MPPWLNDDEAGDREGVAFPAVVVALAVHGVFDYFHARLISNPSVPIWWQMFCLSFDTLAAAYLGMLLVRSKITADPHGFRA